MTNTSERARALEQALRMLRNECHAIMAMSYDAIKDSAGYTNLKVWTGRVEEADALLAEPPPSGASPQAETSDLHAQIMNLPCHRADGQPLSRRSAYREGFRDALIAAAELAAGLPAPVAPQTCEWQINRRSGIGVAGCNSERIDAQSVVVCALAGDTVCFLCGKPLRLVPSDSAPVSPVEPEPPTGVR